MTPEVRSRLTDAVDLNPERSRVTIRRDDARAVLAAEQRLSADVEHYKTACVRLEELHAHMCRKQSIASDLLCSAWSACDGFKALAEARGDAIAHMSAYSWIMPRAWLLYALSAIGGVLVGHG